MKYLVAFVALAAPTQVFAAKPLTADVRVFVTKCEKYSEQARTACNHVVSFATTVDIPLTECDGDFCTGDWDNTQSADGIPFGVNISVWTQGAGDAARYAIAATAGQGLQSQDWPITQTLVDANVLDAARASSQFHFLSIVQRNPKPNGRDILVSYDTMMDIVPKLSTSQ